MWHEELCGRLLQNVLLAVRMALKFVILIVNASRWRRLRLILWLHRTGTLPVHVSDRVVAQHRDFLPAHVSDTVVAKYRDFTCTNQRR